MKFLADESLDYPLVKALRNVGYDVTSVLEEQDGAMDELVLTTSKTQDRILLTCDKDFGELVFRLKLLHSGVILLRLAELKNEDKAVILLQCIKDYGDQLPNSFTVITSRKIRIVAVKNI